MPGREEAGAEPGSARCWGQLPWFEAENLCYWLVNHLLGPSSDPFQSQKDEALRDALEPFRTIIEAPPFAATSKESSTGHERLKAALLCSLFGNRADLSLTAGAAYRHTPEHGERQMLTDDLEEAIDLLLLDHGQPRKQAVTIVTDNCGQELLADLLLVDEMIDLSSTSPSSALTVVLHVKESPVFVSDAIPKDVQAHLEALAEGKAGEKGKLLGERLTRALAEERLVVKAFPFYCTARPFWDLFLSDASDGDDAAIRSDFAASRMVIIKGDANYRRLLGDRHWRLTETSFQEVIGSYWQGSPVLALRTCKSGVGVGVSPEVAEAARSKDPSFLVSGRFAMGSLCRP